MEDLNQHFEQLRRLLVKLNYPHPVDRERICLGVTTELLPLLHFGLLSHSKVLAAFVLEAGYDLYKQNDLRFTEGIFKLLRNEFAYHPVLQCAQFLTDKGFAKRKIQFVVKCLKLGIAKHNELIKRRRQRKQAKVSWGQTELAKKTEREHKTQQAQLAAVSASASTNDHSKARKPKKPRKANTHKAQSQPMSQPISVPVPVSAMVEENFNDSLSADQIRCHLPRPITFQPSQPPMTQLQTQPQSIDEHAMYQPQFEHDDEQAQEESKVMASMDQHNPSQNQSRSDEANQSIQIPQSTYDMNLIPEYDPAAHGSFAATVQSQEMAPREHYSNAHLDTFSTLMMDDEEEDDDDEDGQHNEDVREEHKAHGLQFDQPQIASQNGLAMEVVLAKDNSDEDDDEEEDNDGEEEVFEQASVSSMIIERLDRMESRMDEQFQAINARLTMIESKMKMVEASQTTLSRADQTDHASTKKFKEITMIESKMEREAKEEEAPQSNMFAESTIGSSSLPISLTPRHPSAQIQSFAQPQSQHQSYASQMMSQSHSNFNTSALQPIQPMHGIAATARSPFLGNSNNTASRHSYGSYTSSNVNLASNQSMYGGNPHVDVMRYPVSSSSGNGSGNGNGFVPRIQQLELGSSSGTNVNSMSSGHIPSAGDSGGGGSAADDPDNTLNFINELKEMLKSTDQLLKAKPGSLYDNM